MEMAVFLYPELMHVLRIINPKYSYFRYKR